MSTIPAVPTATPDDLTYRIGWEVIAQTEQQVTVRIRRGERDPGDSDGIPVAVEHEVSLRGTVGTDQITAQLAAKLSPAQRVTVLLELAELAARSIDKHDRSLADVLDYPILLPGKVIIMVRRWEAFAEWFLELAAINFDDMRPRLISTPETADVAFRATWIASAMAFLRELAQIVPTIRRFPDQPHYLLELES